MSMKQRLFFKLPCSRTLFAGGLTGAVSSTAWLPVFWLTSAAGTDWSYLWFGLFVLHIVLGITTLLVSIRPLWIGLFVIKTGVVFLAIYALCASPGYSWVPDDPAGLMTVRSVLVFLALLAILSLALQIKARHEPRPCDRKTGSPAVSDKN